MRDDIRWKRNTPKSTVKAIIFLDLHRHFFSSKQSQRIDPLHSAQLIHLSSILETNFAPLLRRRRLARNRRKLSATIDVSPNNSRFSSTGGRLGLTFSIPSLSSVDATPMATSASPSPAPSLIVVDNHHCCLSRRSRPSSAAQSRSLAASVRSSLRRRNSEEEIAVADDRSISAMMGRTQ